MARSNVHNTKISYLSGYQTVPDGGKKVPSTCGTEEANEGHPGDGLEWACRKFEESGMAYAHSGASDKGGDGHDDGDD